jgi:hypothetical protein
MCRQHYTIVFLSCLALCGLAIVFGAQLQGQQPKEGEKQRPGKNWEFPDAVHHRGGKVGKLFASDYATPKPFDEVWTYYAKKIGYTKPYEPNLTYGGGAGQHEIQILNSTNDPAMAKARRPSAKSATLVRRGAGAGITVFISRATDEDKTYITLIVDGS